MLRVASHVGDAGSLGLPADLVADVVIDAVRMKDDVPTDRRYDVVLTVPWAAPNLADLLDRGVSWVHVTGTGVDAFPFDLLGDRVLTTSRGASAVPISEWALAAMLAFEKRLPEVWHDVTPDRWRTGVTLGGLAGRRLALVGLGAIGSRVARLAQAFEMTVVALRRTEQPSPVPGVELASSLEDLLPGAAHVVLAAPLTAATHHLIGPAAFSAMSSGVHLVNVARGGLVDQEALRSALDDGLVARASLDAVDPEPLPAGHWLYEHPLVRLSPHISWSGPGAIETLMDDFFENCRRRLVGEPLRNVIDPVAGY